MLYFRLTHLLKTKKRDVFLEALGIKSMISLVLENRKMTMYLDEENDILNIELRMK
jgi:hypothetical protein